MEDRNLFISCRCYPCKRCFWGNFTDKQLVEVIDVVLAKAEEDWLARNLHANDVGLHAGLEHKFNLMPVTLLH